MEINQLYSSSLRLIASASTIQLDAKLIAFYTILTVAVSIMLSFEKSRCLLINATTTYPLFRVRKCFKRLKRTKQNVKKTTNQDSTIELIDSNNACSSYFSYSNYTKYLKLKRLTYFALIATKIASKTLKLNTKILKNINTSFSKIR